MAGVTPERHDGNRHVLAHVSFDNKRGHDDGHIPGAIYLDTLLLERPEDWNRRYELAPRALTRGAPIIQ